MIQGNLRMILVNKKLLLAILALIALGVAIVGYLFNAIM